MDSPQPLPQSHVSLQELAKELKLNHVPQRYVQDHREPTFVSNHSSPLPSIPVIDMNDFNNIALEPDKDPLIKLRAACQEWGIFQVKYLYVINL